MQPPKRQIIKTRPKQPYVVARIILIVLALAALIAGWVLLVPHRHPAHAFASEPLVACARVTAVLQEAFRVERMAPIQPALERRRS